MHPISEATLRASFINASLRERQNLTLPADFGDLDWTRLDFLGWRDRKAAQLGYVVAEVDDEPVGILLRQADAKPRSRAQCSWCADVQLPNDVVLCSAKRAGNAGRNGNTLGTLVCANFECPVNVRRRAPLAYVGFDLEAEKQRRIAALREHVTNFVRNVRDGE